MVSAGRLDGRIALVTAAASGIGAASATRLAAEGATVVLTDVADDQGRELAARLAGGAAGEAAAGGAVAGGAVAGGAVAGGAVAGGSVAGGAVAGGAVAG